MHSCFLATSPADSCWRSGLWLVILVLCLAFASTSTRGERDYWQWRAKSGLTSIEGIDGPVLVVGGAGFVGAHLIRGLIERGLPPEQLVVMDSYGTDLTVPAAVQFHRAMMLKTNFKVSVDNAKSLNCSLCSTPKLLLRLQERYAHVILLAPPAYPTAGELAVLRVNPSAAVFDGFVRRMRRCFDAILNEVQLIPHSSRSKVIFIVPALDHLLQQSQNTSQPWLALEESATALHDSLVHSMVRSAKKYARKRSLSIVGFRFDQIFGEGEDPSSALKLLTSAIFNERNTHKATVAADKLRGTGRHFLHVTEVVNMMARLLMIDSSPFRINNRTMNCSSSGESESLIGGLIDARGFDYTCGMEACAASTMADLLALAIPQQIASARVMRGDEIHMHPTMYRLAEKVQSYVQWFVDSEKSLLPCCSECMIDSTSGLCFNSSWDHASRLSRDITQGCNDVFYTIALHPQVDVIHPVPRVASRNRSNCNIAFVTHSSPLVSRWLQGDQHDEITHRLGVFIYEGWTVVPVRNFNQFDDARKASRVPKLSPSMFFSPSVEYAVYVDSKLLITCDPKEFIEMMINSKVPLALIAIRLADHEDGVFSHFKHIFSRISQRPSITYYPEALRQQKRAYRGYERHLNTKFVNLFDGAFMVHNLRSAVARSFRCDWYREYQRWSDRDQVAASYVLTMRASAAGSLARREQMDYVPVGEGHRVKILPRADFHWSRNPGRVARQEFFMWQR